MVPPPPSPPRRSLWWRVHQWSGLQLSLLLAFVLATGTLATIATEIDWLTTPAMRVEPRATPYASWGALADAAHRVPGVRRIERISAPAGSRFAAEVIARAPDGRRFRIQIDPWTAEVRGVTAWINVQRILRELHRHLLLPIEIGLPLVALLSIPLLASAITALFVYKKWWRGFFRLPRRRRDRTGDGRRFIGDLHRFAGLWSLWFVALIAVTGLWYLFEWGGGGAPAVSRPATPPAPAQPQGKPLDHLVGQARKAYPALRITAIGFPEGKAGGVVVMGQAEALLVRERANAVLLDAERGVAVQRLRGTDMSLHQRIGEAADPLHFGTWGGLSTKLLWFTAGLVLTGLAITGALVYAMRLAAPPVGRLGRIAAMWHGMGILAWPAAVLVAVGLVLVPFRAFGL